MKSFPASRHLALLVVVLVASTLVAVAAPTFDWVEDYGVTRHALRTHVVRPVSPPARLLRADVSPTPGSGSTGSTPTDGEMSPAAAAAMASGPGRVETGMTSSSSFTTVGVRLRSGPTSPVLVRWSDAGGWSAWHPLDVEPDVGPDPRSREAAHAHPGVETEPLWIGHATAYQVNLPSAASGPGGEVLLVQPIGRSLHVRSQPTPAGADSFNQPTIHTRSEWGARAPSDPIGTSSALKLAVVHHSDTGNDYGPGDVPAILRSIQAFHIDGRGWSDIAYNLVVDKFGRIWEGRDGSIDRLSTGAHSLGFNTDTVGVMVIGNYESAVPTGPALDAVAEVIAWKFANNRVDPDTPVSYTSGGSLSIPAGETRTFPRIVGHRDVGATSCPGTYLYPRLGDIRTLVDAKFPAKSVPGGRVDLIVAGPSQLRVSGWAIDPNTADPIDVHVYLDGVGYNLGPASVERPELATEHAGYGTAHGFSRNFEGLAVGSHSVCVFAIDVGPGSDRLLGCSDVSTATGSPVGVVDRAAISPDGELFVSGWDLDPDSADPIETHVYLDGVGVNLGPTQGDRPDLAGPFPFNGTRHGFTFTRSGLGAGQHSLCVFAIDVGPGSNSLLECRRLSRPTGSPIGVVDVAAGGPDGTATIAGWSLDPDTSAPIQVHVYLDGVGHNLGPTDVVRPDIAGAFPGYGDRHGYSWSASGLAPGPHRACVFGIDVGPGSNTLLACRDLVVPSGSPIGVLDSVFPIAGGRVGAVGWTLDPDSAAPIETHVYLDGVGVNLGPTSTRRPDLAAAFPGYGDLHGFTWKSGPLAPGSHVLCAFGIDLGPGSNTLLGCRTVDV